MPRANAWRPVQEAVSDVTSFPRHLDPIGFHSRIGFVRSNPRSRISSCLEDLDLSNLGPGHNAALNEYRDSLLTRSDDLFLDPRLILIEGGEFAAFGARVSEGDDDMERHDVILGVKADGETTPDLSRAKSRSCGTRALGLC